MPWSISLIHHFFSHFVQIYFDICINTSLFSYLFNDFPNSPHGYRISTFAQFNIHVNGCLFLIFVIFLFILCRIFHLVLYFSPKLSWNNIYHCIVNPNWDQTCQDAQEVWNVYLLDPKSKAKIISISQLLHRQPSITSGPPILLILHMFVVSISTLSILYSWFWSISANPFISSGNTPIATNMFVY